MSQEINSIKALLKLCFDIVIPILKEYSKDGFQYSDLLAFLNSEEFKNELAPTIKQLPNLGEEFKDFTLEEGFELAGFTLSQVKLIIDALKKN